MERRDEVKQGSESAAPCLFPPTFFAKADLALRALRCWGLYDEHALFGSLEFSGSRPRCLVCVSIEEGEREGDLVRIPGAVLLHFCRRRPGEHDSKASGRREDG